MIQWVGLEKTVNTRELYCSIGIFPKGRSHLTKLKRVESGGGLTCLSARCLSSYLIFQRVPVTSELRAKTRPGVCVGPQPYPVQRYSPLT